MNRSVFDKIGIILILILYIFSGINKILNFNNTVEVLQSKKLIFESELFSQISIVIVILLLTIGSILLIISLFNENNTFKLIGKYLNISFIIFTIMATLLFHYPNNEDQVIHF